MAKKEWTAIVRMITAPPWIVSKEGCSLIINHTQIGPKIVSNKDQKAPSFAEFCNVNGGLEV